MDEITKTLAGIVTAIIGLAILSVIVSKNANTSGVIQSAASGLVNTIGAATAPVTGSSFTINSSYAGSSNSSNPLSSLGGILGDNSYN